MVHICSLPLLSDSRVFSVPTSLSRFLETMLAAGDSPIRPKVSIDQIHCILDKQYRLTSVQTTELDSYDDRNFLVSFLDGCGQQGDAGESKRYVFKVFNRLMPVSRCGKH